MRTKIVSSLVALLALLGCERHRESPAFKVHTGGSGVKDEDRQSLVDWLVRTGKENGYEKVVSSSSAETSMYDVRVEYVLFPEKANAPEFSPRVKITRGNKEKGLTAYFYCGSVFSEQERLEQVEDLVNDYLNALKDRWPKPENSFYVLRESGYKEIAIEKVVSKEKIVNLRNQNGKCSNVKTSS